MDWMDSAAAVCHPTQSGLSLHLSISHVLCFMSLNTAREAISSPAIYKSETYGFQHEREWQVLGAEFRAESVCPHMVLVPR